MININKPNISYEIKVFITNQIRKTNIQTYILDHKEF